MSKTIVAPLVETRVTSNFGSAKRCSSSVSNTWRSRSSGGAADTGKTKAEATQIKKRWRNCRSAFMWPNSRPQWYRGNDGRMQTGVPSRHPLEALG